ncbi:MAG TPA: ABC transporter ATP-binding protein [Methanocellaceae archaeon]
MDAIKTDGLMKVYDGIKAVDSVTLSIGKGEVFGFIGPNGAGKTTMIGMMVGMIEPTGGKCLINDIDVARDPLAVKRITGYLPDGVGFYGNITGRQNLKYFSRFYSMSDGAANKRIGELLTYVGLDKVEKPVGAYSRGMKQRLGLAQALLNDPDVIFMDEPTNGLDPQGVMQFRNVIKDLSAAGKSVFFSSHILDEVKHVCNTIGIISKGQLMAYGTPEDVRHKLHESENVRIIVKVPGEMPRLEDSRIMSATYHDGSAVIEASADIRDDISDMLFKKGLRIRELRIEERTLDELFLESVYRSE